MKKCYNINMINENEFKKIVVDNLIHYRKQNKLTQLQLAEKLNYSDKAISKWERGESLPDIYILNNIAEIYGITLNDLTSPTKTKPKKKDSSIHILITILSVLLVFLVATVCFVGLKLVSPNLPRVWISFIIAIPVAFIILVVYSYIWGNYLLKFLSVSGLCWTIPLALTISINYPYMWLSFISVIPLQFLIIFFIILRKKQTS